MSVIQISLSAAHYLLSMLLDGVRNSVHHHLLRENSVFRSICCSLPRYPQFGNLSAGHALRQSRYLGTQKAVVKLRQLQPPAHTNPCSHDRLLFTAYSHRIAPMQNKLLQICLHKPLDYPTKLIYQEFGVLNIEQIYKYIY